MVIDFHTHAFPQKIAERAISTLSKNTGGIEPFHDGTPQGLIDYVKKSGGDKAVVLNIATNIRQQKSVNDFAISLKEYDNLIPFGSIHPDSEDVFDELERIHSSGLKGIKLHPDYQTFYVDDDKMLPIYAKIAELGLITVFHGGVDIGYPQPVHCTPERLARVLSVFNGAPVVAAHMGGHILWTDVMKHLVGKDVYFDTSYSYSRIPLKWAQQIIGDHGTDKILFGSDMPWSGTDNEIKFILSLGLSKLDEEKILGGNAEKLLYRN